MLPKSLVLRQQITKVAYFMKTCQNEAKKTGFLKILKLEKSLLSFVNSQKKQLFIKHELGIGRRGIGYIRENVTRICLCFLPIVQTIPRILESQKNIEKDKNYTSFMQQEVVSQQISSIMERMSCLRYLSFPIKFFITQQHLEIQKI